MTGPERKECPHCKGKPLPPTDGPDGTPMLTVCGVCTPTPDEEAVARLLFEMDESEGWTHADSDWDSPYYLSRAEAVCALGFCAEEGSP